MAHYFGKDKDLLWKSVIETRKNFENMDKYGCDYDSGLVRDEIKDNMISKLFDNLGIINIITLVTSECFDQIKTYIQLMILTMSQKKPMKQQQKCSFLCISVQQTVNGSGL